MNEDENKRLSAKMYSAIRFIPKMMSFSPAERKTSSFLYILEGVYRYTYKNGGFIARAGDLVYLPRGGSYRYQIESGMTRCIQIELDYFLDGEETALSSVPVLSLDEHRAEIALLFRTFSDRIMPDGSANAAMTEGFLLMLSAYLPKENGNVSAASADKRRTKILPAVNYIKAHFSEKIAVSDLAKRCYLSVSELTRLFQREFGMPPLVYKRKLLLAAAGNMLKHNYNSVGEIADALGFDSLSAFSRFFKVETGISPKAYMKENREAFPGQ